MDAMDEAAEAAAGGGRGRRRRRPLIGVLTFRINCASIFIINSMNPFDGNGWMDGWMDG